MILYSTFSFWKLEFHGSLSLICLAACHNLNVFSLFVCLFFRRSLASSSSVSFVLKCNCQSWRKFWRDASIKWKTIESERERLSVMSLTICPWQLKRFIFTSKNILFIAIFVYQSQWGKNRRKKNVKENEHQANLRQPNKIAYSNIVLFMAMQRRKFFRMNHHHLLLLGLNKAFAVLYTIFFVQSEITKKRSCASSNRVFFHLSFILCVLLCLIMSCVYLRMEQLQIADYKLSL